jgi:hypothetical protein
METQITYKPDGEQTLAFRCGGAYGLVDFAYVTSFHEIEVTVCLTANDATEKVRQVWPVSRAASQANHETTRQQIEAFIRKWANFQSAINGRRVRRAA